jgi:alkanesulfonate monooxygenase SsuD/methylene tetrahydromethanopterin reductase-like flavin-dependent oxidoreductase (luciferase family)
MVILSAVAATAAHLRLGTAVAAVPHYRPHVLAKQLATLDNLTGGREASP